MKSQHPEFNLHEVLHEIRHYLPAQAPLKDFIHHNSLHAFQKLRFNDALRSASAIFGYKTHLTLHEYREKFRTGHIPAYMLEKVVTARKGTDAALWIERMTRKPYDIAIRPRIGSLRAVWKSAYHMDLDSMVHPILFRILCSYLDQGISIWNFPLDNKGFLESIRELERKSYTSFFTSRRARDLLLSNRYQIPFLLEILVGKDQSIWSQYLFDQQFAHQGWAGMVSVIEDFPETLLDRKIMTLEDLIALELLMEIDALDSVHGRKWQPLSTRIIDRPRDLFAPVPVTELDDVLSLWQDAFEWSYYDEVLTGIMKQDAPVREVKQPSFQAMFCIDDRECSLRRYLEKTDPNCLTFGTPGFFGVEFYFKPDGGKFLTKLCPAPVTPAFMIAEMGSASRRATDPHFTKKAHKLGFGWLISQTLGFSAVVKLAVSIFRPTTGPATATSFQHMDHHARLTVEHDGSTPGENGLQLGFTLDEMVTRVENQLRSIGLVRDFAPLIYVVGHGSSSSNNPHYAAYDCGACSGRPGSVNARVLCHMANHPGVREKLALRGINIPDSTRFVGGLHDTTRDEVVFYDENLLSQSHTQRHHLNRQVFYVALDLNAKERSRRLELINTMLSPKAVHEKIKLRSVSLFEPRPELNHATNALCIVGRRQLTEHLFLDRRSFLNSYDYSIDPEGKALFDILKAAAPVCGGINLEYFFSRVDNEKLGAGSKLPHNVMGLFGVANGFDGDLRPGLPLQMIEVHDPVRLMIIVEQYPHVVLDTIRRNAETYEWFINEWVHLVAVDPDTGLLHYFREGTFSAYTPLHSPVGTAADITALVESSADNISVHQLI